MLQCHQSIYTCSLIRLNATLQDEGTFVFFFTWYKLSECIDQIYILKNYV